MTKTEFHTILNKIASKYCCDLNDKEGRDGGIFWCHQDSGVAVDIQRELVKNGIPVWTHSCAFDNVCGRYYVGFGIPRKMEE